MARKNPLRKELVKNAPNNLEYAKYFKTEWLTNFKQNKDSDEYKKYVAFKAKFPERAEKWLNILATSKANEFLRTKLPENSKKILEIQGIQVFLDPATTSNFDKSSQHYHDLVRSMNIFLMRIRGIVPNRKPKILITNPELNPLFQNLKYVESAAGIYYDRMIFISEEEVNDPDVFVHEYAHFIVDIIPTQTGKLLEDAYVKMLDFYWKRAKVKKIKLQPTDMSDKTNVNEVRKMREKISRKLGFPQYGLINSSEFFAVLIENWHTLPNNAITYNYKQLVKNILIRL